MKLNQTKKVAAEINLQRLFVFSLGFFIKPRLRRILQAIGWKVQIGLPRSARATIGVWGRKPVSHRGRKYAKIYNQTVLTVEDAFVRSLKTGRQREPGVGIVVDQQGIYFDTQAPSDLRDLIYASSEITPPQQARARSGLELLRRLHLSKYNCLNLDISDLPPEFVLVVDQTQGDASITLGGADARHFQDMLQAAINENPGVPILIKSHPETLAGKRPGYFGLENETQHVRLFTAPLSPWCLFERAKAVYCVTSQMGMEAIFSGQKPIVFGNPFYAGWGLTDDRHPKTEQRAKRSSEQIFWAAYLQYCHWYEAAFDRRSDFFTIARSLFARAQHWRETTSPVVFFGMRLWKRGFLRRYFKGESSHPRFCDDPMQAIDVAKQCDGRLMAWAGKVTPALEQAAQDHGVTLWRVEDGFLRSSGLGADLVPPVSLALDDLGIYYDPTRESRLERLIAQSASLMDEDLERADNVLKMYLSTNLSKYNLAAPKVKLQPTQNRAKILIPGQVEDDASILKGAGEVRRNAELIAATRKNFPEAWLIYKPHPDVECGLRPGGVTPDILAQYTNQTIVQADIADLLDQVDAVSTITSLTGFEALLRGKKVYCFGLPFYAGWGLTTDFGPTTSRRKVKASLNGLVHATLIDYPRYWDPVTGQPCPPETILERFARGEIKGGRGLHLRLLAKLQGALASTPWLWR